MLAVETWKDALRSAEMQRRLVVTVLLVVSAGVGFSLFVQWVERRPGAVFEDPVLALLPRADLTWLIFGLIYAIVAAALIRAGRRPRALARLLQVYAGMLFARTVVMYLLPLDPPPDAIALADPIVAALFSSASAPTRDLFFSGHTATACVAAFTAGDRRWALAFASAAVVVAIAVLVQRVHYTIDVVCAPVFVAVVVRVRDLVDPRGRALTSVCAPNDEFVG